MRQLNTEIIKVAEDDFSNFDIVIANMDELIENSPDSIGETVKIVNQLHTIENLSPYVIGDLLIKMDMKLTKQGSNLASFFRASPEAFRFSYRTAQNYMIRRRDREKIAGAELDPKKEKLIEQKAPEDMQMRIKNKAIQMSWTDDRIKKEIETATAKEEEKKKKEQKIKRKMATVKGNVHPKEKNKFVYIFDNEEDCRIFDNYLSEQIRVEIAKRLISLKEREIS